LRNNKKITKESVLKALIICRDNIGDTIISTPLIRSVSEELNFDVDILANSYNAAVLDRNANINNVYTYKKTHHRVAGESVVKIILSRLALMVKLRRQHYDVVFIAKGRWDKRVLRWIPLIRPTKVIALGLTEHPRITDLVIPPESCNENCVQRMHRLLEPFGAKEAPGPLEITADPQQVIATREKYGITKTLPVFALHISSRKIRQRWSAENFAALAHRIATMTPCQLMLLWSPGDEHNPRHPGDDAKAADVMSLCADLAMIAVPTLELDEMIAATALCDFLVCSDGGAMHVAAGLHKPIVALFGNSDPISWAPWAVPHKVIQKSDENVMSISVDEVFAEVHQLAKSVGITQ
jgi:ADP-heptose:LPS heptosyltransferase